MHFSITRQLKQTAPYDRAQQDLAKVHSYGFGLLEPRTLVIISRFGFLSLG